MHIETLELAQFRNIGHLSQPFSSTTIVLRGDNGQGKTNVLEALYLAATGRSFRHAATKDMVMHGTENARIIAQLSHLGVRHKIEIVLSPRHRSIVVDGRHLRQITQLLELVNVVAFFPDDLRIPKGAPEERRRFLDRAVANGRPAFVEGTLAYHRVLKSRNALLKGAHSPDRGLLATYDEQLVQYGTVMHQARVEALTEWMPLAKKQFEQIMPNVRELDVHLESGVGRLVWQGETQSRDDFAAAFSEALAAGYPRDRARGQTLSGPHRADLRIFLDGADIRLYGSQGQQRSVVLALKLAEVSLQINKTGFPPILLLDDVSSELDRQRTSFLFTAIANLGAQVWLTTTGAVDLPLPKSALVLNVHNGHLIANNA